MSRPVVATRRRVPRAVVVLALLLLAVAGCSRGGAVTSAGPGGTSVPPTSGAPATPPGSAPDPSRSAIAPPAPVLPTTVRSAEGTDVTITDVSRVLPLRGSINEVVFSLGLGSNVIGRDITATFAEAADLPLVSRSHDIGAEGVLALRPSLILADTDAGPPEALEQIRRAGVPVVVIETPAHLDDINPRIRLIAQALGVPAAGDELVARTDDEIARVQRRLPRDRPPPKVAFLYLRGQAGVYLIGGPRSGADSMIAGAGAVDAGTAIGMTKAFTPITSEALVGAAPDIILMTTTGLDSVGGLDGLLAIPGIAQTPAGQHRRVVTVEDGLLFSFGARTPEALTELIEGLYGPGA